MLGDELDTAARKAASEFPQKAVGDLGADAIALFKAGADWQYAQLQNHAIDGTVVYDEAGAIIDVVPGRLDNFEDMTPVKLIIWKNND